MKKIHLTLLFIAMLALAFVSCEKDEDLEPPTITVSPGTANAYEGDTVDFTATVAGDQELISVNVSASSVGGAGTSSDTTFDKGEHSATVNYSYVVPSGVTSVTLEFLVTDKENLSDTATAVITVDERIPDTLVSIFEDVKLAPASGDGSLTNNCASVDGSIFTYNDAVDDADLQAKCDIVYHYTTKTLLYSPAAVTSVFGNDAYSGWDTKNETMFNATDLAVADFDAITELSDAEIISAYSNDDAANKIEEVAADDVIAFKTAAGKMGLIKVIEVKEGYNSTDYIIIDIKVQK